MLISTLRHIDLLSFPELDLLFTVTDWGLLHLFKGHSQLRITE